MANKRETAGKLKKQGMSALQAGRTSDARDLFVEACRIDPGDAHAWYALGAVYGQLGRFDDAVEATRKSLALQAKNADAQSNLGIALEGLKRPEEAIAAYRKAIALQPGHIEARKNLGGLLDEAGQHEAAVEQFEHALKLAPRHSGLHNDLANALVELKRYEEAETHYHEALKHDPSFSRARLNLAGLQFRRGARESAMADLERFLEETPDDAGAHHNLAEMLQRSGYVAKAVEHYDEALRLDPEFVESYHHRGTALQLLGRYEASEVSYRKALELRPDYAEALLNLAGLDLECGRIEAALAAHERVIELRPDMPEAWNNMGKCLVLCGLPLRGVEAFDKALEIDPDYRGAAGNRLMALNYDPSLKAEDLCVAHRAWGGSQAEPSAAGRALNAIEGRCLRIGYVSPDFRIHSVGYFIESILAAHDPTRFDVFCYAEVPTPDATTRRLWKIVPHWISTCGKSAEEVAEQIRRDRIDILVDLAGYTQGNRLDVFALRPAPVQVSYLGYPNTTGLAAMDYRLTDEVADPQGKDPGYTERLLRLPKGFLCYGPPLDTPDVAPRPSKAAGRITFASFNNLAKVNEPVIGAWAAILNAVPGSQLWLKNRAFADASVRRRYLDLFARFGVDAERLRMSGWTPDNRSHLELYNEVDIALDTFPYNGTTTTCEALWMGVPVVTLEGDRHAGRVGKSIVHRLGLDALCAPGVDEYVSLAVRLAGRPEKLDLLRENLRPLMRVRLCDAEAFTDVLEKAYQGLWTQTLMETAEATGLEVVE